MQLDSLRQKVIFHNSVDVWIALCAEKSRDWKDTGDYGRFISFLLENNLNMKAFSLCAHDAGDDQGDKTEFVESLANSKDNPHSAVYTIKLNDAALKLVRNFGS